MTYEVIACNEQSCPPNPTTVESEWGPWSGCSSSCGPGMRTRMRKNKNGSKVSLESQAAPCDEGKCGNAPSSYPCAEWSEWSSCSKSCGNGYQERTRQCSQRIESESRLCNNQPCISGGQDLFPECQVTHISFDECIGRSAGDNSIIQGDVSCAKGNYSCGNMGHMNNGQVLLKGNITNKPNIAVTVSFWLRLQSNSDKQALFTIQGPRVGADIYQLEIRNGKLAWFHIDTDGRTNFDVMTEAIIAKDKWNHVAATYDTYTGVAKVFANAEEKKIGQGTPGVKLPENWDYAGIGSTIYDNRHFRGAVDEFYLHSCALSKDQIAKIANHCRHRTGAECPSPLLGICPPCENCTQQEKQTQSTYQAAMPLDFFPPYNARLVNDSTVLHEPSQSSLVQDGVQHSVKPAGGNSKDHDIRRRSRVISSTSLILLNRSQRVKRRLTETNKNEIANKE